MNHYETSTVLAKAALYDRRTVGEGDILAWHEILGNYQVSDALEAVTRHYASSREWIMPADVVHEIMAIRNERAGQTRSDALALPSKFENDALRDIRLRAGVAQCRDVIGPILERLQAIREAERGPMSESDQRLNRARQRAREYKRDRDIAERRSGR